MLKTIPDIIFSKLLKILRGMSHCDNLVIGVADYPVTSNSNVLVLSDVHGYPNRSTRS